MTFSLPYDVILYILYTYYKHEQNSNHIEDRNRNVEVILSIWVPSYGKMFFSRINSHTMSCFQLHIHLELVPVVI